MVIYMFQCYSLKSLENPMDKGGWWATVHGVAKSQTWLSKSNFFTDMIIYKSFKKENFYCALCHYLFHFMIIIQNNFIVYKGGNKNLSLLQVSNILDTPLPIFWGYYTNNSSLSERGSSPLHWFFHSLDYLLLLLLLLNCFSRVQLCATP